MEQHLADLQRAQRKKRAMGDNRALEKGALMMPQADQELPNKVEGTLAGTSVSGGAMGLDRVVGAGSHMKKGRGKAGAGKLEIVHHSGEGMAGAGVISDLNIPVISGIARLFGLGKKGKRQGRKAREDEKLGMEVKGLKDKMKGGSYIDPAFGVINQPQGSSEALAQVAGEGPLGSGYSGAGMAKAQGEKMAQYLKELHGEGYAKEFAGGFWGALASIAAPLIGKLISGNGKKGKKRGGVRGRKTGAEYSDEELEMIVEGPKDEYALRVDYGLPVRSAPVPRAAAAAPRAVAPLMPGPAVAAQRLGGPMPAAAGQSAVEAAAAAAGIVPARVASPPAAQMIKPKKSPPKMKGKGVAKPGDRRVARAAVVKKVMAEKGLSLPMASKYVKEHGLF